MRSAKGADPGAEMRGTLTAPAACPGAGPGRAAAASRAQALRGLFPPPPCCEDTRGLGQAAPLPLKVSASSWS